MSNILKKVNLNLFIGLIMFSSCIDKYDIGNKMDTIPALVFEGTIMSNTEVQTFKLTQSVNTYDNVAAEPLANCDITVEDIDGNEFPFFLDYSYAGKYVGHIGKEFLVVGNQFRVHIFNNDNGKEYLSDYEAMTPCPPVDSVYWEVKKDSQIVNSMVSNTGLQFYVDIKADDNYSRFYRWKLTETYEFHATWPITAYYAGHIETLDEPDYSRSVCYNTETVKKVFSTSTKQLDENVYLKYPLQFVSNRTQRLYYRYSLLVDQMSLTEKAYFYWEQLKQNNQESGGLFDKQPAQVIGNIKCITNPEQKVLGYFGVSDVSEKRLFLGPVQDFDYERIFCIPQYTEGRLLRATRYYDWPIYLILTDTAMYTGEPYCFDCTLNGGSLNPPDFWKK